MNAYELADELQELDAKLHLIVLFKSAEMLRQQADRIAELEKQTKPLSDEEINEIKTLMEINYGCVPPLEFAWAIEERHGIK